MLGYIEKILEARERRGLIKDERALIRAKTLTESHRAAFSGCQVVPAGHALVRPAGLQTVMDLVPPMTQQRAHVEASPEVQASRPLVDILELCMNPQQAVRAISGQRQGKSWLVMHIAARWLAEERDVYVIGPKRRPNEWLGCKRQIGPCPYIIGNALLSIQDLARKRMDEGEKKGIPGDAWPPVMVVLDDWLAAAALFKDKSLPEEYQGLPERFITDACVIMASQNVSVYMVAHADTAAAMNVDKIGAALKDDTLGLWVRKMQDGTREYGVTLPAEKGWTKDGQTYYPQYGTIPAGPPVWPSVVHTHTAYPPPEREESSGETFEPEAPGMRYAVARELPPAAPQRVRIKTERGWRNYTVPLKTATTARRFYESNGSLSAVAAKLKLTGSKQVKTALAKAILNIPSPNYTILT